MKNRLQIISVILLLNTVITYGQYYQSGISESSDAFLIKADSLLKAKDYDSAIANYRQCVSALETKESSNSVRQNMLYVQLKEIECITGKKEKAKAITLLDSLQRHIVSEFGNESLLEGYLYFLKGKSWSSYEDALKNYSKALQIREKTLPSGHDDIILSTEKMALANSVLKNKGDALHYSQQFLKLAKESKTIDSSIIVRAYNVLANNYYANYSYEMAKTYYDSTYLLATSYLPAGHKYIKVATSNLGTIYGKLGDAKNQLYYLKKSIELNQPKEGELAHTTLVTSYMELSLIHYNQSKFTKARMYLDTVRTILDTYPEPKYSFEILYCIRASILERNVTLRLEYLEKALTYMELYPYSPVDHENAVYSNLAVAYSDLGVQDKRKLYLEKSLDLQLKKAPNYNTGIANTLLNLAAYHFDAGNNNAALSFNTQSFNYRKKVLGNNRIHEPVNWFQLISLQLDENDLVGAQNSLESAHQLLTELDFDSLHYRWGTWHLKKSKLMLQEKSLDSALHHINLALEIRRDDIGFGGLGRIEAIEAKYDILVASRKQKKSREFLSQSLEDLGVIKVNRLWSMQNTLRFNLWKAFSLYELYQRDFLEEMELEEAISFIKVGSRLISNIRTFYIDNIAEVEFYDSIKLYFNKSIEYLYKKTVSSDSEICQKLLFDLILLNRDIRTSKGLQGQYGSKKRREIDAYILKSNMLFDKLEVSKENGEADSTYLSAREALLKFELGKHNIFSKQFKDESIKGNVTFDQFDAFTRVLGEMQGVLYYQSDSSIYQLNVCHGELEIDQIPIKKVERLVTALSPLLTNWSNRLDDSFESNSQQFVTILDSLSHVLLRDRCLSSEMVIFTDGILLNMPFDILFTDSPNREWTFRELPYLIRKKQVSYASTFDQLSKPIEYKNGPKRYLGVAPVYKTDKSPKSLRGAHSALFFNQLEVSQTQKSIGSGRAILGKEATKAKFLSELENVDWLHLAAHAKFDDIITYQSYFSFSDLDSLENHLYAHEIASLDLPIDLAVLSACETNKGNSKNGLGLLGLAKAFQIAGCNNLVITNWLVDDAASQEVISNMFSQKSIGLSTPVALRKAKLHYLENAPEAIAHPIYWAGFNYYGAIDHAGQHSSFWWLCLPLCLLAFFLFRKKVS